jgi:hypothetical protein
MLDQRALDAHRNRRRIPLSKAIRLAAASVSKEHPDQESEDSGKAESEDTPAGRAVELASPARLPQSAKATFDEYTLEVLDPPLVAQAKREELEFFHKKSVWKVVPRHRAQGRRVVGTCWASCNRGFGRPRDPLQARVPRSQDVPVRGVLRRDPVSALRLILSLAADDLLLQVGFGDISRAYLNAYIEREVYVELPEEAGYGRNFVGRLVKCMYGTRDAAQGGEGSYQRVLKKLGFARGAASPCIFHHVKLAVSLVVHGDDFFTVGRQEALDEFERGVLAHFEGIAKGRLRAAGDEFRILNRIVRRTAEGYEWEADQRHAELLVAGAGFGEDSRGFNQPGRKLTAKELEKEDEALSAEDAHEYRAKVARANFLASVASDHPDIAFSVKELCRGMSSPTVRDAEALKRLARYLLGRPSIVWHCGCQKKPTRIDIWSDSDLAGCVRTRKSTTGGAMVRGSHLLKV